MKPSRRSTVFVLATVGSSPRWQFICTDQPHQILATRQGFPASKPQRQMCIFGGTCSSGNFREMLKQSMSPDDFAKVEQIEQQVLDRSMSGSP